MQHIFTCKFTIMFFSVYVAAIIKNILTINNNHYIVFIRIQGMQFFYQTRHVVSFYSYILTIPQSFWQLNNFLIFYFIYYVVLGIILNQFIIFSIVMIVLKWMTLHLILLYIFALLQINLSFFDWNEFFSQSWWHCFFTCIASQYLFLRLQLW